MQHVQREQQRKGLRRRHQLPPLAVHVLLADQTLDDGGARSGSAQPLGLHGGTQLIVFHQLAGTFHCREQRRLGIARRRLGLVRLRIHRKHRHLFLVLDRRQVLGILAADAAVHRQPARIAQHASLGLEVLLVDARDARSLQILGRGVEHRQEAAHHHVVELLLGLVQMLWRLQRGDDREVIRDLSVVEDTLVRLHPTLLENLPRKGSEGVGVA